MAEEQPARVLQIHLPFADRMAKTTADEGALTEARLAAIRASVALGYNLVEVRDPNPAHTGAVALLSLAHNLGMRTVLTGPARFADDLASRRSLRDLGPVLDLMLVELEGTPEVHDRRWGQHGCFDASLRGVELLRHHRVHYGFCLNLSRNNLHGLRWMLDFAAEQKAIMLRIRSCRGPQRSGFPGPVDPPDELEQAMAYMELLQHAARANETARDLPVAIDTDLVRRDAAADDVDVFLRGSSELPANVGFAERISPLVIEADGRTVPWRRGFGHRFCVADITEEGLGSATRAWMQDRQSEFSGMCRRVHRRLTQQDAPAFFNWHDEVREASLAEGAGPGLADVIQLRSK